MIDSLYHKPHAHTPLPIYASRPPSAIMSARWPIHLLFRVFFPSFAEALINTIHNLHFEPSALGGDLINHGDFYIHIYSATRIFGVHVYWWWSWRYWCRKIPQRWCDRLLAFCSIYTIFGRAETAIAVPRVCVADLVWVAPSLCVVGVNSRSHTFNICTKNKHIDVQRTTMSSWSPTRGVLPQSQYLVRFVFSWFRLWLVFFVKYNSFLFLAIF